MNNFSSIKPIFTKNKKLYEIKKELNSFFDLWEDNGVQLRSEFTANNSGCRIVIVFDWEVVSGQPIR